MAERSGFVTVLAWIFIALAGFSTLISIFQNIMLVLMFPAEEFTAATRQLGNRQSAPPVFDFIAIHYSDSIDLADVASLVSMSSRTFTRFFKKVTGETFVDYLNGFRIEKARRLLATGNKSMAEISQEVGFCNQSYFGAVFRKLAQMSARQYVKQLGSAEEAPAITPGTGPNLR